MREEVKEEREKMEWPGWVLTCGIVWFPRQSSLGCDNLLEAAPGLLLVGRQIRELQCGWVWCY